MKLFFSGLPKSEGSIELNPPGVSIGRELDNDIIIESEAASRYHCKIIWRDGEWYLKDLNSTNGTKLNGIKIQEETKLKEGDEIKIGYQKLIFAENYDNKKEKATDVRESQAKATISNEKKAIDQENTDTRSESVFGNFFASEDSKAQNKDSTEEQVSSSLFFQKEKSSGVEKSNDGAKHASPLFNVIVVLTAVVLVGGFLLIEKIVSESKNKGKSPASQKKDIGTPLTVIYEKQISTPDNIFRYELRIRNNTITVERDDLKHSIRFRRQREVDADLLENLKQELDATEFMSLNQPQAGISADNTDENKVLTIAYGNKLNTIRIRNAFEPAAFKSAVNAIENFSTNILNIPTISLTPEEMRKEAEASFEKAEMLFANRAARSENLREAVKRYNVVIDLLEFFEPKPAIYDQAYKKSQEAKQLIDEQVRTYLVNAQQAYRLNKYEEAIEWYKKITELLEPDDKRYQNAKDLIIKLERVVLSLKKRKK